MALFYIRYGRREAVGTTSDESKEVEMEKAITMLSPMTTASNHHTLSKHRGL